METERNRGWGLRNGTILCVNTVALLPIIGELTPRYAEALAGLSRELAADASVGKVVLYVDSPGGSVAGISDLAADIRALNSKKPVVAYVKGLGASAAYWILSGAGEVVASPSAFVGSLGVVGALYDTSKAAENAGVKVHVITSTDLKGAGFPGAEVTPAHIAESQRTIDSIAAMFKADVSMGRKWPSDQTDKLFDGRVHPAKEALALGLIDRIGALESTFTFDPPVEPTMHPLDKDKPVTDSTVSAATVGLVEQAVTTPVQHTVSANPVIATSTNPAPVAQVIDLTDAEANSMAAALVAGGCPLSTESIVARLKGAKTIEGASAMVATLAKIPVIAPKAESSKFAPKEPEVKSAVDPKSAQREFGTLVEKYIASGKTRSESVLAATKENPALHAAYLASYNRKGE